MIQVDNFSLSYDANDSPIRVLDAICFSAAENSKALAIIGANGCGKTSLAYAVCGIIPQLIPAKVEGVGELMEWAITKGRATRKGIKLGICGEHGGEPRSVEFCHRIGLDYVSCSPYRVPVARLAAAHAALKG